MKNFLSKKLLLLFALLPFCGGAFAQSYKTIISRIDSLTRADLPGSAMQAVDKLDSLARKNKDISMQVKAAVYRVRFQSALSDDAGVAVINNFKIATSRATYPLQPVLRSLLAELYWNYFQRNRYRLSRRNELAAPDSDITHWDIKTLIKEAGKMYQLSLVDAAREQNTPVAVLNGVLEGDTATRYLRPTLYDLLANRALDFFLGNEPAITAPKDPFTLNDPRLFGDSRAFTALQVNTADTSVTAYKGIRYLQQLTLFHLQQQNPGALADVDLRRLEFVHDHSTLARKDALYLTALQNIAQSFSSSPISADALVLLGRYYQDRDSLTTAVNYFSKAVKAFPESVGGRNGAGFIGVIMQKNIAAKVEDVNVPDKPLLASLNYRNIKTARVTLYKIWATQYNELAAIRDDRYGFTSTYLQPLPAILSYLKKLKPLKTQDLQLPGIGDPGFHNTEFKIDPLQTGVYVMLVQDVGADSTATLELTSFKITHLAFATRRGPDNRVQVTVMDRETGVPMQGVQVTIAEVEHKVTDANGRCSANEVGENSYAVKLTTANDTLYTGRRFTPLLNSANAVAPVTNTILFTDRAIYRPGQTVYFKGLHLQNQEGKRSLITEVPVKLTIRDNNAKIIQQLSFVTNAYGSFGGSFVIPQNILNGQLSITTGDGYKYVRVEEYKRPSFTVEFIPVKGNYKPGDSVSVKGNVAAYSGYGISMANVACHVTRQAQYDNYHPYRQYNYNTTEITTDTIKTDSRGQFEIKFKAVADDGNEDIKYRYDVSADVTDGSGETRSANTSVMVGWHSLVIAANVPQTIFASDKTSISATINNLNGVAQNGLVSLNIYALRQPDHVFKTRLWNKPDQYLLGLDDYHRDFPEFAFGNEDDETTWPVTTTVTSLSLNTDEKQPALFSLNALVSRPSGTYKVVISAKNIQGDTVSLTQYFNFINEPSGTTARAGWVTVLNNKTAPGAPAEFLVGTGGANHVLVEKFEGPQLRYSRWIAIDAGKQQLVEVPVDSARDNTTIQFLSVFHNRLFIHTERITGKKEDDKLNIRFLTFRDKLQPGEKEQWKLQISAKNNSKQAAEMVADLYDASLDAVAGADSWQYLFDSNLRFRLPVFGWDDVFTSDAPSHSLLGYQYNFNFATRTYESLQLFDNSGANQVFSAVEPRLLRNAIPGQMTLKGSNTIVRIRGMAEDTVEYKAAAYGIKKINMNGEGYLDQSADKQLKAEIIDDHGDQASTSIIPRKNFAETAFFYPQLQTNDKGELLINFTIPDELTRWRFKAFAHTKDLTNGYIEREILTQKELSISANTPRFLREGDTITISARLANLTASALAGKVRLQLFNAINMQPVSLLVNKTAAVQNFRLAAISNMPIAFKLVIPPGIDALTYRLTAESAKYSDGEENTLPVLPDRMLVTESMPMMVRAGQTRSFSFDKLVNQNSTTLKSKTLTLEYTQNPAWYAVQALPYMMEFPYECSEQVFSRYYANSLATSLVNRLPVIKQVFDQWKNTNSAELLSNLEKDQELKATLIEETPWLRDAMSETEQKKRIALLFDLNHMSYELQTNLTKLQDKQLPDGGFAWFGGNTADRFITQHILAGIGHLYHLNIADLKDQTLKNVADRAITYVDNALIADASAQKENKSYDNRQLSPLEIHAYYTESYFMARTIPAPVKSLLDNYLDLAEKQWADKNTYEQGLIALTMLRNNRPATATAIVRSLNETAQTNDDMGMYWPNGQAGYFWYESPVETQSLMIELFTEAGNNDKAVEEMKIWLLRNKQTSNWKTTKATAAACYALLLKGDNWLADEAAPTITLGGKDLTQLKPDIKADAGTGYIKTTWVDDQIKPALGNVQIKNNGKAMSWGALHWQYLENLDKITPSNTDISLQRKYFIVKQTAAGQVLTAVDAAHQPQTGDLLKVVVYLKCGRNYEYVQLKDMRPAGTEPVDILSAYKYQDGLYYYQVTRDVATSFFISYLNKGSYVFEYQLRVAQPGNFSTGITNIQSVYAPEFNAHSPGSRITIRP